MPCYHPLKGFIIGKNSNTGNNILKVRSYKVDHIEKDSTGKWQDVFENYNMFPFSDRVDEFVDIPCGKCIGCRLAHAKQVSDRAALELQYHKSSYFITITYNDNYVPKIGVSHNEDGEYEYDSLTLRPDDLQKFWKRLRKKIHDDSKKFEEREDYKIRYLACGEYGSTTFRLCPHYHAIVFGLQIPDLKLYGRTKNGDYLFTSEWLQSCWNDPVKKESYGQIWIGDATYESIGYVARYVTKKLYGDAAQFYVDNCIYPEFTTCSRKPGLGRQYYEDHKEDLFRESKYFIPSKNGVRDACTSRYFNKLFESDFDILLVEERKNRLKQQFKASQEAKLSNTDKDLLDYLCTEEYNKIKSVKSLVRNGI